jgi:hypothetical protein
MPAKDNYTLYLADPAPAAMWRDDITRKGYIPIIFEGRITIARPCFPANQIIIPSLEFIELYGPMIRIIVGPLDQDIGQLAWFGFAYADFPIRDSFDNYPYHNVVYFDERWVMSADNMKDKNTFRLIYTADQTRLEINRNVEDGEENQFIELVDGVHKNQLRWDKLGTKQIDKFNNTFETTENGITITCTNGNKIALSPSGIEFADKFGHKMEMVSAGTKIDGDFIVLKKCADWIVQNAPTFGMGNFGAPVPIFPSTLAKISAGVVPGQGFLSNKPGG